MRTRTWANLVLAEGSYCNQIQKTLFSQSIGMILRGDSIVDFGPGEVRYYGIVRNR
jgi:hypothetical protein